MYVCMYVYMYVYTYVFVLPQYHANKREHAS
jgi:hypothetical protein